MADSLCCTTETNTVSWSNYTPIKMLKKKKIIFSLPFLLPSSFPPFLPPFLPFFFSSFLSWTFTEHLLLRYARSWRYRHEWGSPCPLGSLSTDKQIIGAWTPTDLGDLAMGEDATKGKKLIVTLNLKGLYIENYQRDKWRIIGLGRD